MREEGITGIDYYSETSDNSDVLGVGSARVHTFCANKIMGPLSIVLQIFICFRRYLPLHLPACVCRDNCIAMSRKHLMPGIHLRLIQPGCVGTGLNTSAEAVSCSPRGRRSTTKRRDATVIDCALRYNAEFEYHFGPFRMLRDKRGVGSTVKRASSFICVSLLPKRCCSRN